MRDKAAPAPSKNRFNNFPGRDPSEYAELEKAIREDWIRKTKEGE